MSSHNPYTLVQRFSYFSAFLLAMALLASDFMAQPSNPTIYLARPLYQSPLNSNGNAVFAKGVQPAGEWEATFDATSLPSGMYVVRLTAGDQVLTQRVTVMR